MQTCSIRPAESKLATVPLPFAQADSALLVGGARRGHERSTMLNKPQELKPLDENWDF